MWIMADATSGRDKFVSAHFFTIQHMFAGLCLVHSPQADAGPGLGELTVQDLATMKQQAVLCEGKEIPAPPRPE